MKKWMMAVMMVVMLVGGASMAGAQTVESNEVAIERPTGELRVALQLQREEWKAFRALPKRPVGSSLEWQQQREEWKAFRAAGEGLRSAIAALHESAKQLQAEIQSKREEAGALRNLAVEEGQREKIQAAKELHADLQPLHEASLEKKGELMELRKLLFQAMQAKDLEAITAHLTSMITILTEINELFVERLAIWDQILEALQ